MNRQLSLFLTAAQFLTRLPVPALDGLQPEWLAQSARYFPLVGVLVGLIGAGVWWLSSLCLPPGVAVGLALGATLLVTGALHEDGFADACDGFGGGLSRESVLTIMKDSRVGAYGAIGIAMMLGLKWVTLTSLPRASLMILFACAHMVSRWCATALIWRLPYARTDADAKSKPFDRGLDAANWLFSGALGALALLPVILLAQRAAALPWASAMLAAFAAAAVVTMLSGLYFKWRIGGYTGDCLGAAQQISELAFLLAALGIMNSPLMDTP